MATINISPLVINGKVHTVLETPGELPEDVKETEYRSNNEVFNIMMADISGSMFSFWDNLYKGWSTIVSPVLKGRSKVYCYGDIVELARENSSILTKEDFKGTGSEDLTNALKTVMKEIRDCKEKYIRAFIISDGAHCLPGEGPETVIASMSPPTGKIVEVYMIGVGMCFPVKYSISIRSLLHNGPTNMPYIFWPKYPEDIDFQMELIAEIISKSNIEVELNLPGSLLPGQNTQTRFNLSEFVIIDKNPEDITELDVTFLVDDYSKNDEEDSNSLQNKKVIARINNFMVIDLTYERLKDVFNQWNVMVLQSYNKKEPVDMKIFDIMKVLFDDYLSKFIATHKKGDSKVLQRQFDKKVKQVKVDFSTMLNQSKNLIDIREGFCDEIELADMLVKTTISGKYETKALKLKGHTIDDFKEDVENFTKIYTKLRPKINEIPAPIPEDCCRIMVTSTISDLQDPGFEELLQENKFEFLKTFTITGIPILALNKDSTQMNSWTFHIENILVSPYEILSLQALESGADMNEDILSSDKSIKLQSDDENSRFNAVIPVLPTDCIKILLPLLKSKIFAMCCTFSILRNVHIIDYDCHVSALGVAWVKTIHDFPKDKRPEYITKRIDCIIETSQIYSERKSFVKFIETLLIKPKEVLMTENTELNTKCESLVKPMFLLYAYRYPEFTKEMKIKIVKLIQMEFIGRCDPQRYFIQKTRRGKPNTPFVKTFLRQDHDEDKKKDNDDASFLSDNNIEKFIDERDILNKCYFPAQLKNIVKLHATKILKGLSDQNLFNFKPSYDAKQVENCSNSGSCGDITWDKIKSWAREIEIPEEEINILFSSDVIKTYIYHSMKHRSSKDRMNNDIVSVDDVDSLILKEIIKEKSFLIKCQLKASVTKLIKKSWMESYADAHDILINPMTENDIINEASKKGIDVTSDNFNKIYKYNKEKGLLRNACMSGKCPHYLQPSRHFNEHVSVERNMKGFVHNLHKISSAESSLSPKTVLKRCSDEGPSRKHKLQKLYENRVIISINENNLSELMDKYRTLG